MRGGRGEVGEQGGVRGGRGEVGVQRGVQESRVREAGLLRCPELKKEPHFLFKNKNYCINNFKMDPLSVY